VTTPGLTAATRRQRLQLLAAAALMTAAEAAAASGARLVSGDGDRWVLLALAVPVVVLLVGSVASGTWVRRHVGLLLAAAATVVTAATVVLLAAIAAVLLLGRLPTEDERPVVLPLLVGAGVAAVCFGTLRGHATAIARRALHGVRLTPEEVLHRFAERAGRGVPLDELLLQLAESLRTTLSVDAVEIWTGGGAHLERVLSVPHRTGAPTLTSRDLSYLARIGVAGDAWLRMWLPRLLVGRDDVQVRLAPATASGSVLGLVLVERAADAPHLSGEEERTLAEVVRQLGVVLHNRQLDSTLQATLDDLRDTNAELRASRARLVAAADAERRRIERDIHDGAQQHLVALAVSLGLARDLVKDDPIAAAELLDEVSADIRTTIAEVRDLAHGIYPPLLKESGIAAALTAAGARCPVPILVEADALPRLEQEVETAVYFCCLEAMQNAVKHAPGEPVTVRLRCEDALLRFEVRDDGPGFDPQTTSGGQGRQNMADRIGAVGGRLTWTTAPGRGTTVVGAVPCAVTV
jgi:signal transduction histidine kinase